MKKAIYLLGILSLLYFSTEGKTIKLHGTVKLYKNSIELEQAADLIVVGKPEKHFSEYSPVIKYNEYGRYEDFYTTTDIKVLKEIKGSANSETIPVMQYAALIDSPFKYQKDLLTLEGYSTMNKNEKYLLFLKKIDNGSYSILSVYQGKFNIDNLDLKEKEINQKNNQYKQLRDDVLNKFSNKF